MQAQSASAGGAPSDSSDIALDLIGIRIERAGKLLLRETSAQLRRGQIVGLVGPNGIGKTSLLSVIVGDLHPKTGKVVAMGQEVLSLLDRSPVFGLTLPPYNFAPTDKVRNAVAALKRLFEVPGEKIIEVGQLLGVDEFAHMKMKELSTGMRKKFDLLLATMTDAPILILDEPTNGLDLESVEVIRDFIRGQKERGKLIIISSHIFSELDTLADRLFAFRDGELEEYLDFTPGAAGSTERAYKAGRREEDRP